MWSSTLLDELGYLPFEAHAAHLFFQLVSRRYPKFTSQKYKLL